MSYNVSFLQKHTSFCSRFPFIISKRYHCKKYGYGFDIIYIFKCLLYKSQRVDLYVPTPMGLNPCWYI